MRHVSMGRINVIPEIVEPLGGGSGVGGGGMGARSVSSPNVRPRSLLALPTVIVGDGVDGFGGVSGRVSRPRSLLALPTVIFGDGVEGVEGVEDVAGRNASRSPLSSMENADAYADANNANNAENVENADNTDASASTEDESDGLTMVGEPGPSGSEVEASDNSDASEKNQATVVLRPAVAVLKGTRTEGTPHTPTPTPTPIPHTSADVNAIKAKLKSKMNTSFSMVNFGNVGNVNMKAGTGGKRWSFWKRREEREQSRNVIVA